MKSYKKIRRVNGKVFSSNKGQVWVETVIYTLIAFALIGAVLSFVRPKIGELQDNLVLEQSVNLMKGIDKIIFEVVQEGSGNKRKVDVGLKKGLLTIDGENDLLMFDMDSGMAFSEPGIDVNEGNLIIRTESMGDYNHVNFLINYSGIYNLSFGGEEISKQVTSAQTSYTMFISNKGEYDGKTLVDIEL